MVAINVISLIQDVYYLPNSVYFLTTCVGGQESLCADKAVLCVFTQCVNTVFDTTETQMKSGRPVAAVRAKPWNYLQQLYRIRLLTDSPDPAGESVQVVNLLFTRLDLLPVDLEGKLCVFINEFLDQHFLFVK